MVHKRTRINARIAMPNRNRTIPIGNKTLVDAVFNDIGLNDFLDNLKRNQGESVAAETRALVSNSAEMTGISIERLDCSLSDDIVGEEYGLGGGASKSIYRTVERLGMNSDAIVRSIADSVKKRYRVGMETVFKIRPACISRPLRTVS